MPGRTEELMKFQEIVRGDVAQLVLEFEDVVAGQVRQEPDRTDAELIVEYGRYDGAPAIAAFEVKEMGVVPLIDDVRLERAIMDVAERASRNYLQSFGGLEWVEFPLHIFIFLPRLASV